MFEHKPISELTGVVTYRCETPHPTRNELSMFYTDVKRQADDYKRLGWTVTPLSRYVDPNTVIEEAFSDTEMRMEAAVAKSREGAHDVYCSLEDGNPLDTTGDDDDDSKPFCRIEWYADGGDPTVGIPATYGWVLARNQEGTWLADDIAAFPDEPLPELSQQERTAPGNADVARWALIRERFAAVKTSRAQNVLDALGFYGDPADDLNVIVDEARGQPTNGS